MKQTTLHHQNNGGENKFRMCESALNGQLTTSADLLNLYNNQTHLNNLKQLGLEFSKENLNQFAHRSFVHEHSNLVDKSYERFEFLGDAVIELIVTEYLLENFDSFNEGELSKFRSSLVNEDSLTELAKFLGLGHLVLLGKGEVASKAYGASSILSDLFEALIGGHFSLTDFVSARELFLNIINKYEKKTGQSFFSINRLNQFDAKTKLQELCVARFKETPTYADEKLNEETFLVSVSVKGVQLAQMESISKKKAQKELAKKVLDNNLLDKINE